MDSLQATRSFYARVVTGKAGAADAALLQAFESVEREHYLGPGPWRVHAGAGYVHTVSDDPRLLYQDVLVAIDAARGINNGQPSLHAGCIAACKPQPGEQVLHVGAGTGYYTAILAELVGPGGQVTAYEIESDLAQQAQANLAQLPQVRVAAASAAEGPLPEADVIYVCAGATHPLPVWLDALRPGGRLVFPLTPQQGWGCMLLVTRVDEERYAAAALATVSFIPCIGARDPGALQALERALATQSTRSIRSLRRAGEPDASAWCAGQGWWLSTAEP